MVKFVLIQAGTDLGFFRGGGGGGIFKNFPSSPRALKRPVLGKNSGPRAKTGVFGHFLDNFDQKIALFGKSLGCVDISKYISLSGMWISQNSTKGGGGRDPLEWEGVESLREGASALNPPPPPHKSAHDFNLECSGYT